jgi:alkanesulfonate monooxygenase SsuD/methylene tetrahydromethanopterin reductase-like flavin-dependent oxidoreductase (luciferase family)
VVAGVANVKSDGSNREEMMARALDFGMFDWLDRGPGSTAELYEARLELVEMAERAGFYGYHMAEHHGTQLGMAPSPALFFAALTQRTSRIRFGPMAYLLPLYHPVRLVEELCMLDHLSGGRVEMGVGRGVSPYEQGCYGVAPDQARELFDETLEILRAAMTHEVLNHRGKHYQFHDVPMPVKPLQRPYPPLWYPSFTESGTTYAAEQGYHFMCIGPPTVVTHLTSLYREVWASHRDRPGRLNGHIAQPRIGVMRQVFLADSDEEAMAIAAPAYAGFYRSITELWHRHEDSTYDEFFRWEKCLAGETVLVGSARTVGEQIRRVVAESGVDYFVGSFAWGGLTPAQSRRSFELFVEHVVPAVRGGGA